MNEDKLDWIQNKIPRGEDLPVECKYQFSKGKPVADPTDIPVGWEMEWVVANDPEIAEAGFEVAVCYLVDGQMQLQPPYEGATPASYLYLRDQDGKIVATWDEGRWWTSEESAAFKLMLLTPATYFMAEQGRFNQLPRRYRRRLK